MFKKECPVCGGVVSHRWQSRLRQMKTCSNACGAAQRVKLTLAERVERGFTRGAHDECWLWRNATNADGYGVLAVGGRGTALAHRVSYEVYVGDIPEGLYVLHRCDTPACVNPAHLFLGTHQDNMDDRDKKGRGVQPSGTEHHAAKLNPAIVREIRSSEKSLRELGRLYGVGFRTIHKVKHGITWKDVN